MGNKQQKDDSFLETWAFANCGLALLSLVIFGIVPVVTELFYLGFIAGTTYVNAVFDGADIVRTQIMINHLPPLILAASAFCCLLTTRRSRNEQRRGFVTVLNLVAAVVVLVSYGLLVWGGVSTIQMAVLAGIMIAILALIVLVARNMRLFGGKVLIGVAILTATLGAAVVLASYSQCESQWQTINQAQLN